MYILSGVSRSTSGTSQKQTEGTAIERTVVEADDENMEEPFSGNKKEIQNEGYTAEPSDLDITINYIEGIEENF